MDSQEMHGTPRDGQFLDTVAFGSMLVFASVMPPLGADEADVATPDEPGENDLPGLEGRCAGNGEWACCA
jgi:hypothetical protein